MNSKTTISTEDSAVQYRPRLSIYHPNSKGTGCAIQLELIPARGNNGGAIFVKFANQNGVGVVNASEPKFPKFDWSEGIVVKLDFVDICKILQVLRGECEEIDGGRGIFHRTATCSTKIMFKHLLEPVQGYSFEVYRHSANGEKEAHSHILLNSAEALGICESMTGSLPIICFGVPSFYERGTK